MKKIVFFGVLIAALAFTQRTHAAERAREIFTPEMAARLFGTATFPTVRDAKPDSVVGKSWVSTVSYVSGSGPGETTISVLIQHATSASAAQAAFASNRRSLQTADVASLGDAAYRTKIRNG